MDDWLTRPAAEQGRAIGSGQIDPRDLTEAYLAAADVHPDRDLIYVRLTPERARAEAKDAHQRQQDDARAGPLDGVPISWKDLYDTAGIPTEGGSRILAGRTPERDCPVLTRAVRAGLVCLGKTHTTEMAFSGLGVNPMTATPPNAIDPPRAPGGSSSGAAVSTKLGLAAAGIGSDTGGSVRVPAGWNDLVGLKTTAGLIPTEGVLPLAPTYDTVGPLCHTVEDTALLFGVLADCPVPEFEGAAVADDPLHVAETVVLDGCDPEVVAAFETTLDRLGTAGARISRGAVPEFEGAVRCMKEISPVVTAEAWASWGEAIKANPGVMYDRIETRFRQGEHEDPAKVAEGRAEFARLSDALHARIAEHGLLVMPTSPHLPPLTQMLLDDEAYFTEKNLLTLRNTRLGNLLICSSLTVPTGTPMCGFMLFAAPGQEARLLRAGRAIEKALAV